MHRFLKVALLSLPLVVGACFRNTVHTGLEPSNEHVVLKSWAPSWFGGMIGSDVKVDSTQCRNGVATIDTGMSFLNTVVWYLTGFIYTPVTIVATCAKTPS